MTMLATEFLPQSGCLVFSSSLHSFFGQMLLCRHCRWVDFTFLSAPFNMPIECSNTEWTTTVLAHFIDWTQTLFSHGSTRQRCLLRSQTIRSCWCNALTWSFIWCIVHTGNLWKFKIEVFFLVDHIVFTIYSFVIFYFNQVT